MNELNEIVKIVDESLPKNNSDISSLLVKEEQKMYDLIKKDLDINSNELSHQIFGSDKENLVYKKFRNSLKRKLIGCLSLIDSYNLELTDQEKAYFRTVKSYSAAKILYGKSVPHAAVNLSKRILKLSKDAPIIPVVVDVRKELMKYYANEEFNIEMAELEYNLLSQDLERVKLDAKAEWYFADLQYGYTARKETIAGTDEKASKYYQELVKDIDAVDSEVYRNCTYKIGINYNLSIGNYEEVNKIAQSAIKYFLPREHSDDAIVQHYIQIAITSNLSLHLFDDCIKMISTVEDQINPQTAFWFKVKEYMFLLLMRNKSYQKAADLLESVIDQKYYKRLDKDIQERWEVFGGYIFFLQTLGDVKLKSKVTRHKINKFVNEFPDYNEERRIINIPTIIAQLLFAIYDKHYDVMVDRLDGLEDYCAPYLKHNKDFRSNVFIKMLSEIPRARFHPIALQRYTEKIAPRLSELQLDLANPEAPLEIIPYEDIWKIVTAHLKAPRRRRKFMMGG